MIGCIYKIITKDAANRLRGVMDRFIGLTQTAFVQGRQISDGTLIANEGIHWVKKKRESAVIVKLDFHKAYDSVKWKFMDYVFEKMGSSEK